MAKIFRPKRGTKTKATTNNIKLENGELFCAYNASTNGNGAGQIYIGDGATSFSSLKPFIQDPSLASSTFTSTANGSVPASGGGTAKYMRADGTWATPPNDNTDHQYFAGDGLRVSATNGYNSTFAINSTYAFNLSAATVAKATNASSVGGFTVGKSVPSNAVFTDASVTAVGNHYTPSTNNASSLSVSATGATAAWSIDVVKGVTIKRDAKGHVTGLEVTSGKIPAKPIYTAADVGALSTSSSTCSGQINFTKTDGANMVIPARSLTYLDGAKGNAGIYAKKTYNENEWYPALCLQTKGGGSWQIGNYSDENLQFVYFDKAKIDASTNTPVCATLLSGGGTLAYTTSTVDNANKLGGYTASSTTVANSIAQRTANGYLEAVYFKQYSGAETPDTSSYWIYANSDGFFRKSSRLNTAKALTNSSVTAANFVVGLTSNWASFGYTPVFTLSAKGTLGWGTNNNAIVDKGALAFWNGAYQNTASNLEYCARGSIVGYNNLVNDGNQGATGTDKIFGRVPIIGYDPGVMEVGQYIDFHIKGQLGDYSSRIWAGSSGSICGSGAYVAGSSRKIKKNIEDITQEEADKILQLRPVRFDYISSESNDRSEAGFIAEEVYEFFPYLTTPESGDEEEHKFWNPMGLKYEEIIPHLVKVCQRQQNEIDELKARLDVLEK